ncbi:TniQ family protein [Methylogaea oryzae]|uniref:TniQ family protein n=1 Tax=Methylogaea oryzae TaxID=1295382 RepID=UPI00138F54BB
MALGARNTKRHGGLQYCPSCLAEDAKPYYRLQWRLAWHTGCQKHGCLLLDRCRACGAPVEPHRLLAEDRHVAVCATCKAGLGEGSPVPQSPDALALQRLADAISLQGHGVFHGQTLTTAEWFGLADFFISLCRRQNRYGTEAMRGVLNRLGAPLPDGLPVMAGAGVERLLVHDREKLLGCLWRLMDAGGDSLATALKEVGVTRQGFCNRREPLPSVLSSLVDSLPDRPVTRNRKPRQETGVPRSRDQVMRMMLNCAASWRWCGDD